MEESAHVEMLKVMRKYTGEENSRREQEKQECVVPEAK